MEARGSAHGTQRHALVVTRAQIGTADALVGIGGLFGTGTPGFSVGGVVRTAAGAAADAEQPEEASPNGKSGADPGDAQDLCAYGGVDAVVFLESAVQGALEHDVDGRHGDRGSQGHQRHGCGAEGGEERAPTGEYSRKPNHQRHHRGGQGEDVQVEDSLAGGVVGGQAIAEGFGKKRVDCNAGVVQAPDVDRVEPEVGLRVGAVCVRVVAVPAAVAAHVDGVVVLHAQRLFGRLERTAQHGRIGSIDGVDEVRGRT